MRIKSIKKKKRSNCKLAHLLQKRITIYFKRSQMKKMMRKNKNPKPTKKQNLKWAMNRNKTKIMKTKQRRRKIKRKRKKPNNRIKSCNKSKSRM